MSILMTEQEILWLKKVFVNDVDPFWLSRHNNPKDYQQGIFQELNFLVGEDNSKEYKIWIENNISSLFQEAKIFHGLL